MSVSANLNAKPPKIKRGDKVMIRCYDNTIAKVPILRAHRDGTFTVPNPNHDSPLLKVAASEIVPDRVTVQVEHYWGKRWTGSHYEETPGEGAYYVVMETNPVLRERGPSFRGCPLGSGTTESAAIYDFVNRGKSEYHGIKELSVDMIVVISRKDRRTNVLCS